MNLSMNLWANYRRNHNQPAGRICQLIWHYDLDAPDGPRVSFIPTWLPEGSRWWREGFSWTISN